MSSTSYSQTVVVRGSNPGKGKKAYSFGDPSLRLIWRQIENQLSITKNDMSYSCINYDRIYNKWIFNRTESLNKIYSKSHKIFYQLLSGGASNIIIDRQKLISKLSVISLPEIQILLTLLCLDLVPKFILPIPNMK